MAALTMCDRCSEVRENYDNQRGWVRITATDGIPTNDARWFDLCPDCWIEVLSAIRGEVGSDVREPDERKPSE